MEKTKIVSLTITVILILISVLIGFLIINIVNPPEFDLFTSNYSKEMIKEYFDTMDYGIYGVLLAGILPAIVFMLLKKLITLVYKPYRIDRRLLLFEALAAGAIIYFMSEKTNYGIAAEISYFLETYFWL